MASLLSLRTQFPQFPQASTQSTTTNPNSTAMNTVKSFWVGWGSLIVAGGGAYYFAKVQINADRREKYMKRLAKQQQNDSLLEYDPAGFPAREGSADPAPTRHSPQTEQERIDANGQFEANGVYKTKRGDRFS